MSSNKDLMRRIKQLEMLSNTETGGFYVGDYNPDNNQYKIVNASGKAAYHTKASLIAWMNRIVEKGERFTLWFGLMPFEVLEFGHPTLIKVDRNNGLTMDNQRTVVIQW